MRRNLNSLLIRGLLGSALSGVALVAAATQAARFEGEVRVEAGRLVLLERPGSGGACLTIAPPLLARVAPD